VEQALLDLVQHYGYLIVFLGVGIESLGIPVPGETVLIIGAVLAGHGHLDPVGVAVAGVLGATLGDTTGYYVGRRWGRRLIRTRLLRRVYDPRRLAVAERFFERHGWSAVFFGRFIAILRIFAGPLAGLHHMPWRLFLLSNAGGAAVWVGAVVAAGLLIGGNLDHIINLVSRAGYVGLALGVALVVAFIAWHQVRKRRELREGGRLMQGGDERREADVAESPRG
jgi:membrane protein DedA with SNARE-associated domain